MDISLQEASLSWVCFSTLGTVAEAQALTHLLCQIPWLSFLFGHGHDHGVRQVEFMDPS